VGSGGFPFSCQQEYFHGSSGELENVQGEMSDAAQLGMDGSVDCYY